MLAQTQDDGDDNDSRAVAAMGNGHFIRFSALSVLPISRHAGSVYISYHVLPEWNNISPTTTFCDLNTARYLVTCVSTCPFY